MNSEHLIPKSWHIKRVKVERNLFKGKSTFGYEIVVSKQPLVERGIYNKEPVARVSEDRRLNPISRYLAHPSSVRLSGYHRKKKIHYKRKSRRHTVKLTRLAPPRLMVGKF